MANSPYDPDIRDVEYREYEWSGEGTKTDGMSTIYADARFDYTEDEGYELTDIDCRYAEGGLVNGDIQHWFVYVNGVGEKPETKTMLDLVKEHCIKEFGKEK